MASSTTRRNSLDDPREDVGKEVRVGVGDRVGAVECQLDDGHTEDIMQRCFWDAVTA